MRYFEKLRMDWLAKREAPFNRADLMAEFEISMPQASKDINKFIAMNPGVLRYNKRDRRYERNKQ